MGQRSACASAFADLDILSSCMSSFASLPLVDVDVFLSSQSKEDQVRECAKVGHRLSCWPLIFITF